MRRFTKIFGIGLSRTGTYSLHRALEELGLSAVHFPKTSGEIERHQVATDTTVASQFELLDAMFPGSLYILTTRSIEDWLASVERYWASFEQFTFSPEIMQLHETLYGASRFDRAIYRAAYQRHHARVRGHFATRQDALLEINVCAGDGWAPLCAFLDTPVPAMAFPREYVTGSKVES